MTSAIDSADKWLKQLYLNLTWNSLSLTYHGCSRFMAFVFALLTFLRTLIGSVSWLLSYSWPPLSLLFWKWHVGSVPDCLATGLKWIFEFFSVYLLFFFYQFLYSYQLHGLKPYKGIAYIWRTTGREILCTVWLNVLNLLKTNNFPSFTSPSVFDSVEKLASNEYADQN